MVLLAAKRFILLLSAIRVCSQTKNECIHAFAMRTLFSWAAEKQTDQLKEFFWVPSALWHLLADELEIFRLKKDMFNLVWVLPWMTAWSLYGRLRDCRPSYPPLLPPAPSLSVALFHAHCLHCKALRDLLSAGVSLMGCNNTAPFSPAKVVESPPSADERTPAGCPVCACVLWQTYKPGSSTPWLSKQGFSTGAQIKKSSVWGLRGSETAGCCLWLFIYLTFCRE